MINLDKFPHIKMSNSWEPDQEFPDTPETLRLLRFYEKACERATTLSVYAASEIHCPTERFDGEMIVKQAFYWQTVKRAIYAAINLMSVDPDTDLSDCLYDPFVK